MLTSACSLKIKERNPIWMDLQWSVDDLKSDLRSDYRQSKNRTVSPGQRLAACPRSVPQTRTGTASQRNFVNVRTVLLFLNCLNVELSNCSVELLLRNVELCTVPHLYVLSVLNSWVCVRLNRPIYGSHLQSDRLVRGHPVLGNLC